MASLKESVVPRTNHSHFVTSTAASLHLFSFGFEQPDVRIMVSYYNVLAYHLIVLCLQTMLHFIMVKKMNHSVVAIQTPTIQ